MTEAANGIPVACLPMVLHRELVVLGNALVIGRATSAGRCCRLYRQPQYFHIPCGSLYARSWFQDLALFMLGFFFSARVPANLPGLRRFRRARHQQNRSNTIGLKANKFRSRCPLWVIRGCQCRPMSAVTPIADKGGCARIVR
jgi:hypothetical protein